MTATLSAAVPGDVDTVRALLLDPHLLPDWNPAFLRIAGPDQASTHHTYSLSTIGGLKGSFAYTRIDHEVIGMTWSIPGMTEICTWTLSAAQGDRCIVTHTVERSGPLARVLRGSLQGLPKLRLDRLTQQTMAG
jgi:hypothetical protein